jgi:PleD family two-component response regulator
MPRGRAADSFRVQHWTGRHPTPLTQTVHSILIVEDTPEIAEALQRHLERRGYATLLATRAAQALPLACSEHPDLVGPPEPFLRGTPQPV